MMFSGQSGLAVAGSLSEALTARFYAWEQRGRGWRLWEQAVDIEPPFEPFFHYYLPGREVPDDGRVPTFLSTLSEAVVDIFTGRWLRRSKPAQPARAEPVPRPFEDDRMTIELALSLPPDLEASADSTEQLLVALGACHWPVSFEIFGTGERIEIQLACRESEVPAVRGLLRAYFPEVLIEERFEYLSGSFNFDRPTAVVDCGLCDEFMRPLQTFRRLEPDPLIGVLAALEGLEHGELGVFQVVFQGTRYPWSASILRSVTDWQGDSFFVDCPEMLKLAREKVERPLMAALVRVAGQGEFSERSWQIARTLAASLRPFDNPPSNELIALSNDGYDADRHLVDLLCRQAGRSGMLLNTGELVAMVHLPSPGIRLGKLTRERRQSKLPPAIATGQGFVLGENCHQGKRTAVSLSRDQRLRHTYVIGATGTGKSTLLLEMIAQDLRAGMGVGVLDPHGDLVDHVLAQIPEARFDDVVLLDPADVDYPVGLNILSARSELERNVLASDLVAVFKRLSTTWGDQMTSVLGNAVLAILESSRGGTLADLRRFLVERDFRQEFLRSVRDEEVVYYWQKEFPLLSGRPQASVLTRLDSFLRPKPIRQLVTRPECLDFQEILNCQRIFLAKLPQGLIGKENAHLLGALLVSKFHQAAMARQAQAESQRRPFFLYVDEFQDFITPSMADILSGTRKYGFGLVLAHQELRQLWDEDKEVAHSVISNPGTRICFRLGDIDARRLADGFSFFEPEDLQNLGVGEAICRVERAEYDFNLRVVPVTKPADEDAARRRAQIIELSRRRYGQPVPAPAQEPVETIVPTPSPLPPEPQPTVAPAPGVSAPPTEPAKPAPRPKRQRPAAAAQAEGKGGAQHKYLQSLIKQIAEAAGYRATIELATPDGCGSVDVGLERDGQRIACEISVTTTGEQELGNIRKCLAAGYHQVILCSTDARRLERVKKMAGAALDAASLARVLFLQPEELLAHVSSPPEPPSGGEQTVKGYRVKVQYKQADGNGQLKREAVAQVIAGAMRRITKAR